jgi:transcription antitermination factor NusG
MNWYALQVMTGKEQDVAAAIRRIGIQAIAPEEQMLERHGGEWKTIRKTLIPGYVLIHADMTVTLYYNLSRKPHVIKLVGGAGEKMASIPDEQIMIFHGLMPRSDDPAYGISHGRKGEGGRIEFTSGPLATMDPARILKVDARRRRATVEIQLYDETYQTDIALILDDEDDKQP